MAKTHVCEETLTHPLKYNLYLHFFRLCLIFCRRLLLLLFNMWFLLVHLHLLKNRSHQILNELIPKTKQPSWHSGKITWYCILAKFPAIRRPSLGTSYDTSINLEWRYFPLWTCYHIRTMEITPALLYLYINSDYGIVL